MCLGNLPMSEPVNDRLVLSVRLPLRFFFWLTFLLLPSVVTFRMAMEILLALMTGTISFHLSLLDGVYTGFQFDVVSHFVSCDAV